MSRHVEDLDPAMISTAYAFMAALDAQGIPYAITCTLRTQAEQIAYYAQGREPLEYVNRLREKARMVPLMPLDNTYTVTMCDGIRRKSSHQSGRAMDVVPADKRGNPLWPPPADPRWNVIGIIGEAVGLQWGGRWTDFPDFPHYQYKT